MDSLEGSVSDRFRVPIATAAILAKDNGLDGFRRIHLRAGGVELVAASSGVPSSR